MEFIPARDLAAVYVLNLRRRPDRMAIFREVAAQAGLTDALVPERIEAVDGRTLQRFRCGGTPSESACTMGHRYMWGLALQHGKPVLILEDDAVLCANFADHLHENLPLPDNLDILQLGMSWLKLRPGSGPVRRPRYGWGTFAYVVFPHGAARLLQMEATSPLKAADRYLFPSGKLQVALTYPMWATLRSTDSDIAVRAPTARRMGRHFEDDAGPEQSLPTPRQAASGGGDNYCSVCERNSDFEPFGKPRRAAARCRRCGTLERHRLLWLYLQSSGLLEKSLRILHFAPESALRPKFSANANWAYATASLKGGGVTHQLDMQNISLPANCKDLVVCSHVLEHVPDDRRSMREVLRILSPGGMALFMVPIRRTQRTIEDFRIRTPKEREKYFGQHDHVRWYGMDITQRLAAAGFQVEVCEFTDNLREDERLRLGLQREPIFVCRKP